MTTVLLTKAEMRERIEEIAMCAFIPPPSDTEALVALIARVRAGVEEERRSMSQHLDELIRELDGFAASLAATTADATPEQSMSPPRNSTKSEPRNSQNP